MSKPVALTTTFANPERVELDMEDCDSVYGDIDPNTLPFDIELLCDHDPAKGPDGILRCCKCHDVLGFARSNMCGNE